MRQTWWMSSVVNINDVLDGHVGLEVECVDRTLCNACVSGLQVPRQVLMFLTRHVGNPVPSPVLFGRSGNMTNARNAVAHGLGDLTRRMARKDLGQLKLDFAMIDNLNRGELRTNLRTGAPKLGGRRKGVR